MAASFNGRDLQGWKMHPDQPGNWVVENGTIVCTADPRSHLFTERGDFQDFILRAEVRLNANANSGITVCTPFELREPETPRVSTPNGYEVQLAAGQHLDGRRQYLSGGVIGVANTMKVNLIEEGRWHRVTIKVHADQLETWIDDVQTLSVHDPQRRYNGGHIALQVYLPGTKAEFRKIELRRLPPPPVTPPASDPPVISDAPVSGPQNGT
jgi:hypothetical protein